MYRPSAENLQTHIYLNKPHSIIKSDVLKIMKEIQCIRFKDVLKSYTFYFDNSLSNNPVLTKYHNLEEQLGVDDSIMYQWVLRFLLMILKHHCQMYGKL